QSGAFESGYQRHLAWHKGAGDRWSWFGWYFVLGDRLGQFMDGTFFHAADDFDHAVAPAEDRADNGKNVDPYADFLSHGIYEQMPQASAGSALPDRSPFLAMTTYFIAPGRADKFEALLQARHKTAPHEARYTWYRLNVGGEAPQYVLLRPAASFGAAASLKDPLAGTADSAGVVTRTRSELLRFAPQMSYQPEER
ncbi:MAG TPA: hypothetical protein VFF16_07010, partial [Telluria sp.]|nr:hypothetical protein [Telluria sp.]